MQIMSGRSARGWLAGASMLGLCVGMATTAYAQEGAALEEVVVTAQKRSERLQDVPLSVAVVSGTNLERLHISSPDELPMVSPNVSFTASSNTRGQGLSIRGVGTLNFSDGVEPSVSTVIDGVVLGRQAMSVFELIDIERVEILRGPQGTLFGKNSSAGVLNIVTEAPRQTFGGKAEVSYASLNETKLRGSVTGPLSDTLSARLTGYYTTRDGYVTNVYNGKKLNDQNQWGVRGKILWTPTEATSVTFIGDYSKIDRNCCAPTSISVSPTATGAARLALMGPVVPGRDNNQTNIDGLYYLKQDTSGLSVQVDHEIGEHTLTSITAYRQFQVRDNNDPDLLPVNLFNLNNADQKQSQFSQELRLTSPQGKPIEYVVGLYYFGQDLDTVTMLQGRYSLASNVIAGSIIDRGIETKNAAVFGQLTGHVTDQFSVIVGARYTSEKLDARFMRTNLPGLPSAPVGVGGPPLNTNDLKSDEAKLSYRLGVQYDINDDAMAYASYAKGFKGGAINLLNTLTQSLVTGGGYLVPPEIPTNYEAGVRLSLFERRAQLNLTAFLTDFDGFQTTAFDPNANANILTSAGKLRSKGIEVEALASPVVGLTLSANVAYTDATFREFPNGPCYPGQALVDPACRNVNGTYIQDLAGKNLNNAPEWAYTLGVNYQRPIADTGFTGLFNLGYVYRDKVNFGLSQDPQTVQKAYGLVNLNLGVQTQDQRWKISVFAKNLLDERFSNGIFAATLDSGGPLAKAGYSQMVTESARRSVGIALNTTF